MSNHTPGPWQVLGGDRCYHVASTDEKFETGCIMFAGVEGDAIANARLIAAAPALYDALKFAVSVLSKAGIAGSIYAPVLQKARAALELAEKGEQG